VVAVDLRGVYSSWLGASKSIFIWGAQLEQRSSVTAYTTTTTAPITNYIPALQTAASGVARFEHNPVTGESLGLEIEEQRTNVFQRSEEFDNVYWTKTRASVSSNSLVAPDGTIAAETFTEDSTASNSHFIDSTSQTISAGSYTFSVYAKNSTRRYIILQIGGTSNTVNNFAVFDLQDGLVSNSALCTAAISAVGNNWYRCSISLSLGAGTNICTILLSNSSTGSRGYTYSGDGYSGVYIWGAQLEAGSFATSYIPTVASQVTRSQESATMTGTNFSSWYRADEGTLYGEFNGIPELNFAQQVFKVWDGTNNNRTQISLVGASDFFVRMVNGGALQANLGGTPTANTAYKIAGAYKTNDTAVSISGASALTDTSCILPVVNQAVISSNIGTIKKLAYYPLRLTNAELQGLTTV